MKKRLNFFLIVVIFNISFLPLKADTTFDLGKKIFLGNGNCATCHTLADAKSNGQIGPNLNQIRPDIARVLNAVNNGIGVMPAYEGILTSDEINAVAEYVYLTSSQ